MVAQIQTSPIEATDPFEGFQLPDLSKAAVLDIDLSALPPEWALINFLKWQQTAILLATVHCNDCGFYSHNFPCISERGVTTMTCPECDKVSKKITVNKFDRHLETEKQLIDGGLMSYIETHPDDLHYFSLRLDNRYIHTYSNPAMREKSKQAIERTIQQFYKRNPHLTRYENEAT